MFAGMQDRVTGGRVSADLPTQRLQYEKMLQVGNGAAIALTATCSAPGASPPASGRTPPWMRGPRISLDQSLCKADSSGNGVIQGAGEKRPVGVKTWIAYLPRL